MSRWTGKVALAGVGATVYAAAGAGLLVAAFRSSGPYRRFLGTGALGQTAKYLLLAGPLLYVLSWFIEFAIFGILALAFGLISLALAVWIGRVAHVLDRGLISLSAAGSLTWNTETVSVFYWWAWVSFGSLSIRLLPAGDGVGDDFSRLSEATEPGNGLGLSFRRTVA